MDKVAADGRLEIAPLANMPVVRDLVADMREFFDKWARSRGQFKPTRTRNDDFAAVRPDSSARAARPTPASSASAAASAMPPATW